MGPPQFIGSAQGTPNSMLGGMFDRARPSRKACIASTRVVAFHLKPEGGRRRTGV